MQIQNHTTWKSDHLRALIEAAARACGVDAPALVRVRRSRYMRLGIYDGLLWLRLPQPNATPLEILGIQRYMNAETFNEMLVDLVETFVQPNHSIEDYEALVSDCRNRRRQVLGLPETAEGHYTSLSDKERRAGIQTPAWAADLPLIAGEKPSARRGEMVETIRTQLLLVEREREEMLRRHEHERNERAKAIEALRQRLAQAEAKLTAPKRTRRPKALTG